MRRTFEKLLRAPLVLVVLVFLQLFCAVLFSVDLVSEFALDGRAQTESRHLILEMTAIFCLLAGISFEWREGVRLLRRTAVLEKELRNARSAVLDLIEAHFDSWDLTPSERDVAGFVVKGLTTAEIASLRGSAEATVKAHLNAVYRKSGTTSRAGMLSCVIDSLINDTCDQKHGVKLPLK